MGAKQSANSAGPRVRTYSNAGQVVSTAGASSHNGAGTLHHHHHHHHNLPGSSSSHHHNGASAAGSGLSGLSSRSRARSLGSVSAPGQPLVIPNTSSTGGTGGGSPDSDNSTPDDAHAQHPFSSAGQGGPPVPTRGGLIQASSLPVHLLSFHGRILAISEGLSGGAQYQAGIKCPVCSKFVPPDDIECHLVMCLTKPRINYNEDVLSEDKGECVICFDDLKQGDTIARLPCLCIYHKGCIDSWFKVNRSCPEHPVD